MKLIRDVRYTNVVFENDTNVVIDAIKLSEEIYN